MNNGDRKKIKYNTRKRNSAVNVANSQIFINLGKFFRCLNQTPKLKLIFVQKLRVEQIDATQICYKRGLPPHDFSDFLKKYSLFNAVWITF